MTVHLLVSEYIHQNARSNDKNYCTCVLPVLTKGMYIQHEDLSSCCILFAGIRV